MKEVSFHDSDALIALAIKLEGDADNIGHNNREIYPVGSLLDAAKALRAAAYRLAAANAIPIRAFATAILHGDDEHREWLLEAAECFTAGKPMPPARGKGAAANAIQEPVATTLADLSKLPRDMYVIGARSLENGIAYDATMCSVPMAVGPEVRYVRADLVSPREQVAPDYVRRLEKTLEAAMKFIDSHVADPDITNEMAKNYTELLELNPKELLEKMK